MKDRNVGSLDAKVIESYNLDYQKDPKNAIVRHALSRHAIPNVVFDSASLTHVVPKFSLELKTLPVADQKMSGRCWIFAGLNVLREIVAARCHTKNFELSQNYVSLYDKIEKSNFALETILKLGNRDHDDRELAFVLKEPVSDGGQWDMFVNLVKKYGVMPKDAFPETYQSEGTRESNQIVNCWIRAFAAEVHPLLVKGDVEAARKLKNQTMERIYHFFLNCFGVPPKTFDFEYLNEKKYCVERNLTPQAFFEEYIGDDIDEYQSIINAPTSEKPFHRNYTIDYLGNVVEGKPINHLNLPMDRIKEIIIDQLSDGKAVWFGSDVSFYRDRNSFAWSDKTFDYATPFGADITFEKGQMLDYWCSAMNHAMVITGVNLVNGVPDKWKIENSWGSANGVSGYYVMSAGFFDHFVYQAVVMKKYLTKQEREEAAVSPIHLHPWDPMGTLAD